MDAKKIRTPFKNANLYRIFADFPLVLGRFWDDPWDEFSKKSKFRNFRFFGKSNFLRFPMKMSEKIFFTSKKLFFISKKCSSNFFQIDITSSDLNEFWIGQKIWRATPVLFLLSTISCRKPKKGGRGRFFSNSEQITGLRAPAYLLESSSLPFFH